MYSRHCCFETFRNIIELKYVRLKSNNVTKEKTRLTKETIKHHSEILCKILNCNILTATEIVAKNKQAEEFNHHNFYQNANFCKNYLKLSDIVEFPSLLTLDPSVLQHRYFSLKELGFYNVTPSYIFRFPSILKKTPHELKEKGFSLTCEYKSSILAEYLNVSQRTEVHKKLKLMYKDGTDLQKIKEVMNAEFLSAKLDCSIGTAHQMLHKNIALRVQSISNTDQLLNILLYKFGFSLSKICSSLTVLSLHHENVEQFLSEFPEILGVSTLFLVKRLPLLLKQRTDIIQRMDSILREFSISPDQLMCCPKVLSVAPSTLQRRLTALCSSEDFAVFKSNKKFLWLVYYFKNLNPRLKRLKDENIPATISMFTASKDTFENSLMYSSVRRGIRETHIYLAETFKMSEKEISTKLIHHSQVESEDQICSALNCRKVVEFLLLSGVSKNQILNGLEIVYFDVNIVKFNFNNMKFHPLCQPYDEWNTHSNFIQLLLYIIKYHPYNVENEEELYLEVSSNYSS